MCFIVAIPRVVDGHLTVDWIRYGHVARTMQDLENQILHGILSLFEGFSDVVSVEIPDDLRVPSHLGKGIISKTFVAHLY